MADVCWHAASAVPFLLLGEPAAAAGCLLPDLAWIPNEIRFRLSGTRPWTSWAAQALPSRWTMLYWFTHSMLLTLLLWWLFPAARSVLSGCLLHQLIDLPTHSGVMAQRPAWPFPWRWRQ